MSLPDQAVLFPFSIGHIDPLGQGVCKKDDSITFIGKTLPGESGTAQIYKRKKGVQFARLQSLQTEADNRTVPAGQAYWVGRCRQ